MLYKTCSVISQVKPLRRFSHQENLSGRCVICNDPLPAGSKNIKKYCSKKCLNKGNVKNNQHNKEQVILKEHPEWLQNPPLCDFCKNPRKIYQKKYCSDKCAREGWKVNKDRIKKILGKNKGKVRTVEQREKIRQIRLGTKASEETRKKMSVMRRGVLNANFGNHLTEAQKENLRNHNVRRSKENPNFNRSKSEIAWGKIVEALFDIALEHSVWLEGRCFDYRYQNYLFEIDGTYWHSLPHVQKIDQLKNKIAEDHGYKLYRFSIADVPALLFGFIRDLPLLQQLFQKPLKITEEDVICYIRRAV